MLRFALCFEHHSLSSMFEPLPGLDGGDFFWCQVVEAVDESVHFAFAVGNGLIEIHDFSIQRADAVAQGGADGKRAGGYVISERLHDRAKNHA